MAPTTTWPWMCAAGRGRQLRQLVDPRGQDHRGGEQEGKRCGVLMVEFPDQSTHHAHPRAADPGQQRQRLEHPDERRLLVVQGVQPAVHPGGHRDTTGHPTLRAVGCLAAQQLTREQDQPVEGEEDRRRFRCGDTERSVFSRASPRMPTRDGDDADQHRQALGGRLHGAGLAAR